MGKDKKMGYCQQKKDGKNARWVPTTKSTWKEISGDKSSCSRTETLVVDVENYDPKMKGALMT